MFGLSRRRRAAEEAAREAERRALFDELARRPAHVCPFLGLAYERTGWVEGASIEHRCFAFGDPATLSSEQQIRVCQERGYGHCPRYLRGVLVIPSEELARLRDPQPTHGPLDEDEEPEEPPPPLIEGTPARPIPVLLAAVLAVLLVAAGAGAYILLSGVLPGAIAAQSAAPDGSVAAAAEASPSPTPRPSRTPAPTPSRTPRPTPVPTPDTYEVLVQPGTYVIFQVDDDGAVLDERTASFGGPSSAEVEPIEANDGGVYWRTLEGGLAGFAYRYPDSGDFEVRAIYEGPDGSRRAETLDEDELDTYPEASSPQ